MNVSLDPSVSIRKIEPDEPLSALTEFLHRAFQGLAAKGLNVTAATQSLELTQRRTSSGVGFLAERDGTIVGSALLVTRPEGGGPLAFYDPGTAVLGQFAVDFDCRGLGVGTALIKVVEAEARQLGYETLALDTPEPARHLVEYYEKQGFSTVALHQWPGKTYLSAVMVRRLHPLPEH